MPAPGLGVSGGALHELRADISGEVIGPGESGYDRCRSVFNQMVDGRPAAIVRCRSAEDVGSALAFRAEHDLPVAVRSGGTSDHATVDDGIVIDISPMKSVEIDAAARIARIGPGLTWGEFDAATQQHGLAVTGGRVSGLGVAGVALGGGTGWLERMFGPTCQSLIGAEVVLADGQVERASETSTPDLLWALRGGGGNFGVVTELVFRLHPVGPRLLAGLMTYPRERVGEVARFYRDYLEAAPDELGGGLLLFPGRGGALTVAFCFVGAIEDAERMLKPLRELRPSMDAVAPNDYRAFQRVTDLQNPFGMRACLRGGFVRELTGEALERAIARANQPASSLSHVMLRPMGGAMSRLDHGEMALRVPDARWSYECRSLWPPVPSLDHGNIEWTKGFADEMEPFTMDGTYPSLIGSDRGEEQLVACYGSDGYAKLRRLKARYDPENVFRLNPNVQP